jgi:hypothetical protein
MVTCAARLTGRLATATEDGEELEEESCMAFTSRFAEIAMGMECLSIVP